MNIKTTLQLTGLAGCMALLTACGGSDDSTPILNNSAQPTPQQQAPTNTNSNTGTNAAAKPNTNTTNNAANSTVKPATSGIQGTLIAFDANHVAGNQTASASTTELNKVVIAGEAVDFMPAGFSVGQTINMQGTIFNGTKTTRVGGGNRQLSYTRYGYIQEGDNGVPHLFAQGTVTPTMPATGTAKYTGNAAHVNGKDISIAQANFDVDYGNKTLQGTISADSETIALSANINGNAFSGTNSGYTTQGYFYGADAAELGGTYRNANGTISGAYGAKK